MVLLALSLLIQYGISFNFQQNLDMLSYWKAMKLALISGNPTSLSVVRDSAMPDPANVFHKGETVPYSAGGSAVFSEDLYDDYYDEDGNLLPEKIPKVDYIINGRQYTLSAAAYKKMADLGLNEHNVYKKVKRKRADPLDEYNVDGTRGSDDRYWYWQDVSWPLLKEGAGADLDGDGKEEVLVKCDEDHEIGATAVICQNEDCGWTILTTEWPYPHPCPECGGKSWKQDKGWEAPRPSDYLDFQEGDIDFTVRGETEEPQGLQPTYTKQFVIPPGETYLEKHEGPSSGIQTESKSKVIETIKRVIKRNKNRSDINVQSTIEEKEQVNWSTP
jgi:hypothetical protein